MNPTTLVRSRLFPVLGGMTHEGAAARAEVLAAQARAAGVSVDAYLRGTYPTADGSLGMRAGLMQALIEQSGRYRFRPVVRSSARVWLEFLEADSDVHADTWAVRCQNPGCGLIEDGLVQDDRPRRCRLCDQFAVSTKIPESWVFRGDADWSLARAEQAGALKADAEDGEGYDPRKDPLPTLWRRALAEGARAWCAPLFSGAVYGEGEVPAAAPSMVDVLGVDESALPEGWGAVSDPMETDAPRQCEAVHPSHPSNRCRRPAAHVLIGEPEHNDGDRRRWTDPPAADRDTKPDNVTRGPWVSTKPMPPAPPSRSLSWEGVLAEVAAVSSSGRGEPVSDVIETPGQRYARFSWRYGIGLAFRFSHRAAKAAGGDERWIACDWEPGWPAMPAHPPEKKTPRPCVSPKGEARCGDCEPCSEFGPNGWAAAWQKAPRSDAVVHQPRPTPEQLAASEPAEKVLADFKALVRESLRPDTNTAGAPGDDAPTAPTEVAPSAGEPSTDGAWPWRERTRSSWGSMSPRWTSHRRQGREATASPRAPRCGQSPRPRRTRVTGARARRRPSRARLPNADQKRRIEAAAEVSRRLGLKLRDPLPSRLGGPCEIDGCEGKATAFNLAGDPTPYGARCRDHVPPPDGSFVPPPPSESLHGSEGGQHGCEFSGYEPEETDDDEEDEQPGPEPIEDTEGPYDPDDPDEGDVEADVEADLGDVDAMEAIEAQESGAARAARLGWARCAECDVLLPAGVTVCPDEECPSRDAAPLVDPAPEQVSVVGAVASAALSPRHGNPERRVRAERWLSCPLTKSARKAPGPCRECGVEILEGESFRRGVSPAGYPDDARLSKRGVPIGVAHPSCVEALERGEQPHGATT